MNPSDHDFEVKMNTVISEIGRHIEMEEDELFMRPEKHFPNTASRNSAWRCRVGGQ